MKRGAGPGDPIHPGHGCPAIHIRVMESLFLKDAENARLGGMTGHPSGNLRTCDESRSSKDVDFLLSQRDDECERLAKHRGQPISSRLASRLNRLRSLNWQSSDRYNIIRRRSGNEWRRNI